MYPVVIIPARLHSRRLANKMLLPVDDTPLIKWVYDRIVTGLERANTLYRVVVATEDKEIARLFRADEVVITGPCRNGTERVCLAARELHLPYECVVVNWQGDEVKFDVNNISKLLHKQSLVPYEMCTASVPYPITHTPSDGFDKIDIRPGDVSVVLTHRNRAMYFSRFPIPYVMAAASISIRHKHVGVYTYSVKLLNRYIETWQGRYEQAEHLEQLRALENDIPIYVERFEGESFSINNQEDYDEFIANH